MRVEVEVRLRTARDAEDLWAMVRDPQSWPPMPGADLTYRVTEVEQPRLLRYALVGGLPVREHEGVARLEPSGVGGTEIFLHESFRARLWGTAGYLRGRRERALVDLARVWAGS
jgi:hypothetical protein